MKDIREKVKDERSFLKKIELAIPGFRGYRKREDLRIADSMLRDYISRMLDDVEKYSKAVRENLTESMALDELNIIGKIVNQVNKVATEVRHGEQGYMGLVGDYYVKEEQLNNLYEFDLNLINRVQELKDLSKKMADLSNINATRAQMREFMSMLDGFEELFHKRRDYMLEVFV